MPTPDKEPVTMARRFLTLCLAVLAGVFMLSLAVQLLSQFWVWLVLIAVVALDVWIISIMIRARRDRW